MTRGRQAEVSRVPAGNEGSAVEPRARREGSPVDFHFNSQITCRQALGGQVTASVAHEG